MTIQWFAWDFVGVVLSTIDSISFTIDAIRFRIEFPAQILLATNLSTAYLPAPKYFTAVVW